jgi:hypothetical protein
MFNFCGSPEDSGDNLESKRVHTRFRPIHRDDLLLARSEFGLGETTHQMIREIAGSGADRVKAPSSFDVDLAAVKSGTDSRTSLMIRDVPTAYTQEMLLKEFVDVLDNYIKNDLCEDPSDPLYGVEFFYLRCFAITCFYPEPLTVNKMITIAD